MDGVPEPMRLAVDLDGAGAAAARRFLRGALQAWDLPDIEDVATLLVSEVVSNVVLHAHTPCEVTLGRSATGLRVEVHDGSTHLPAPRPATTEASSGRGMQLLSSLSTAWGVRPTPDGKVVWFEVAPPAGPTA